MRNRLQVLADTFRRETGYTAPYWKLVELARQVRDQADFVKGRGSR
jgi:hypothetical protein